MTIQGNDQIRVISPIRNLRDLTLIHMENLETISKQPSLQEITIVSSPLRSLPGPDMFPSLVKIYMMNIEEFDGVVPNYPLLGVLGLYDLKRPIQIGTNRLMHLTGGRIDLQRIENMPRLQELELANSGTRVVRDCPKILDVEYFIPFVSHPMLERDSNLPVLIKLQRWARNVILSRRLVALARNQQFIELWCHPECKGGWFAKQGQLKVGF